MAALDRQGLFADLAAAMSGFGANVVGAKVYTSTTGRALDVFYVQDSSGAAFGESNPGALGRLTRAVEAAARGEEQKYEARKTADFGRAAAFTVAPAIAIDNETSDAATVVEVSGRDRPGLLEALTRTLANAGLSIQSAHVDNYGERAVDVFYVTGADGGKLTETKRLTALKNALGDVLQETDPDTAKPRLRLEKARASVAR